MTTKSLNVLFKTAFHEFVYDKHVNNNCLCFNGFFFNYNNSIIGYSVVCLNSFCLYWIGWINQLSATFRNRILPLVSLINNRKSYEYKYPILVIITYYMACLRLLSLIIHENHTCSNVACMYSLKLLPYNWI